MQINNAVISNESALLHFLDRLLMGEPIDKLLFEVASLLIDLFENILKKVSAALSYQKASKCSFEFVRGRQYLWMKTKIDLSLYFRYRRLTLRILSSLFSIVSF